MNSLIERLLSPDRLYNASEVLGRQSVVPASAGVYAWYFSQVPGFVDATACHRFGDHTLLYVGISPKAPPTNGKRPSQSTLRKRLQTHYGGNAEGSTLRLTLGCLLSEHLGIKLRRVGNGTRHTFTNPGEQVLDRWMQNHAFVTWVETNRPWELESQILASGLHLPLNIDGNCQPETVAALSALRSKAKQQAKEMDIIADNGGPRKALRVQV
ncbi:GIY-YIG nuclease family protein [Microvirga roseola]|uniref:GIY-YIG nuclease family protein n=1 Tax=Microvirga roseola TaxID=2883126 RepID=UPI001E3E3A1F|nr:hypothetical protein [Microvirga roseola]